MCVCGDVWGSVVVLMVLCEAVQSVWWCRGVCACMGRVASVASVVGQWHSGWFRKTEEDRMRT